MYSHLRFIYYVVPVVLDGCVPRSNALGLEEAHQHTQLKQADQEIIAHELHSVYSASLWLFAMQSLCDVMAVIHEVAIGIDCTAVRSLASVDSCAVTFINEAPGKPPR